MAWFDDVLRSAGTCPTRESSLEASPCSAVLGLGLTVQEPSEGPRRWVTSAGWGSPDAALYVLGTTPKWHAPQVPGPNYADVEVDRGEYAREFTLRLFPEFLLKPESELRETTEWTLALAKAWCGRDVDLKRDVFVVEMMLCPQTRDPSPRACRKAYRQCMDRHFLRLVAEAPNAPIVVILGAGGTRTLYEVRGTRGPVPSTEQVVVVRRPDGELPFQVLASLAPMGAKMAGLSRRTWVERMLGARDQLSAPSGPHTRPSRRNETMTGKRGHGQIVDAGKDSLLAAKGLLPFFPEPLLGLQRRWGRRWSVMQAFAYGGTVDDILQRALQFDRRRSLELGVAVSNDIEGDRRYLRDESGFYARELRNAGWSVLRWEERWVIEPPAAAAAGLEAANGAADP